MYEAIVVDVIPGLFNQQPVAALVVRHASGELPEGARFQLLGREWVALDEFAYTPSTDALRAVPGPLRAVVVQDGDDLFSHQGQLAGQQLVSHGTAH